MTNFRVGLETGDRTILERALRDRRFDATVERALRGEGKLSKDQIDRMAGRYRERMLKYRAETIARTESMTSIHAGSYEAIRHSLRSCRAFLSCI